MFTVLLLTALSTASQNRPLPDSTYLHLVGDLPALATFSYSTYSANRRTDVHRRMRNVDVTGCMLKFEIWVQQVTEGAQQSQLPRNFYESTYAIPLNAIDPERTNIRMAHARIGARYDSPPSVLEIRVKQDAKPVVVGTLEQRDRGRARTIEMLFADDEAAALVKGWLHDAAARCETWDTTPLQPIR